MNKIVVFIEQKKNTDYVLPTIIMYTSYEKNNDLRVVLYK